jgi:predicted metalloenzyme YecM
MSGRVGSIINTLTPTVHNISRIELNKLSNSYYLDIVRAKLNHICIRVLTSNSLGVGASHHTLSHIVNAIRILARHNAL